jgi:outer membrane protein assembly factor BamB
MLPREDTLYIIDQEWPSLLAVDLSSKEMKWTMSLEGMPDYGIECLSMFDDALFIAGTRLSKLSSTDGQLLWQTHVLGRLECPDVLASTVYIRNTDTTLFGFDLVSGKQLGTLRVEANTSMKDEPDRSPLGVDGLLLVPKSDHEIAAYRP